MAATKTLEDIITEQAPIVCEQIEAATAFAESEMDLQFEMANALEVFCKEAGFPELKGHHNITVGEGHPDSVYDYVVIQYKKPGLLKDYNEAPKNREVIQQLNEKEETQSRQGPPGLLGKLSTGRSRDKDPL